MNFKPIISAATLLLCSPVATHAENDVTLTFNRTGTAASDVAVTVEGVGGATATLTSASHAFKATASNVTSAILCPNVNGNTGPTITMEFTVSGLPSTFKYNTVGLDIHALNGANGYQSPDDNKTRNFNVSIETGNSSSTLEEFGFLNNIDIAAGVGTTGNVHKVWDCEGSGMTSATDPLVIKLTITKGSANEGCFFGLSSIKFSDGNDSPVTPPDPIDPDPEPVDPFDPAAGKIYNIKWKNNTESYMTAVGSGMEIAAYNTSSMCFWQFIPTDNENCYYIRNTANGLYIGSCNMEPSSSSKVKLSATPVEYYVCLSASSYGENKGCYYLSSTDCANYNSETSQARCLNKDGASESIITWKTGLSNYGSYWTLVETENLYEVRPFEPAAQIGKNTYNYLILSGEGKALSHDMKWEKKTNAPEFKWYFVGSSNAEGGYQIVNADNHQPINDGSRYSVSTADNGLYAFTAPDDTPLTIDGVSAFNFRSFRNQLSSVLQLYTIPCGSTSTNFIKKMTIEATANTLYYPMPEIDGNEVTYPVASRPADKYTILSRDVLRLNADPFDVDIELNSNPTANLNCRLFMDWDCDGDFEDYVELEPARTMHATVTPTFVKDSGKCRMRLRISDNGLKDADDEIAGQAIDFMVQFSREASANVDPDVKVNDPVRGTASYDKATSTANAVAKGTSLFIAWNEGHRVIGTESTVNIAPSPFKRVLTAIFSPNLDLSGIETTITNSADGSVTITNHDKTVNVASDSDILHILAFDTTGALAARSAQSDTLWLGDLPAGIYIIKVITAKGVAAKKIIL